MEAEAIQELVIILSGILVPLVAGGGVMKYKDNKKIAEQTDNINRVTVSSNITEYKYNQLKAFALSVSDCLADDKITAVESKMISGQLKRILGADGHVKSKNETQEGGFVI